MYADILPGKQSSPAYPFGGFVININICTRAHRDMKDRSWCAVLPMGDFKGGELCFFEPGLVLELHPGDLLIFPSRYITHFNLHFTGKRVSLDLHSDRDAEQWIKDRNGWAGNKYMN